MPKILARPARGMVYFWRRYKHAIRNFDGHTVVPRNNYLVGHRFQPISRLEATGWFDHVHRANEAVRQRDGSWHPHPFAGYAGCGITIEEVALRIMGYLSAFRATGEQIYLDRASAGGEYLIKYRIIPDGHVILLGHVVCDWSYTLAGRALLGLWEHDSSLKTHLSAAKAIAGKLMGEPISGSINHGSIPAQLFAKLYRYTGDDEYLDAALKRVSKRLVAFQQPSGDWDGHENRIWYQGVNLSTLIDTYLVTPSSEKYLHRKDKIAAAVVAAFNNFVTRQDPDGALALTRYDDLPSAAAQEMVIFDGTKFNRAPHPRGYIGHGAYELDALIAASQQLDIVPAAAVADGYAIALRSLDRLWRLEFNTLGVGRYLEFIVARAAGSLPTVGRSSLDFPLKQRGRASA